MDALKDPPHPAQQLASPADTPEQRRLRLQAALKAAEGLWKNRTDAPKDGIEYQEQLRAEWP